MKYDFNTEEFYRFSSFYVGLQNEPGLDARCKQHKSASLVSMSLRSVGVSECKMLIALKTLI